MYLSEYIWNKGNNKKDKETFLKNFYFMLSAISKSLEIIIIIENLSSKCIWESQLFYKERWLVLEFSAILEFRPNVSTAKSI